jgi:hypothetical protein
MPAHSPSKTGVNALLSRASTSLKLSTKKDVDGRVKPGHDAMNYFRQNLKRPNRRKPEPMTKGRARPGFFVFKPTA